jgi:hypothetical protein
VEANLPQPEEGFRALGGDLYIVHSEAGLLAALKHFRPENTDEDHVSSVEDFVEKFEPEYPCFVTVGTLCSFGAYYSTYAKV